MTYEPLIVFLIGVVSGWILSIMHAMRKHDKHKDDWKTNWPYKWDNEKEDLW